MCESSGKDVEMQVDSDYEVEMPCVGTLALHTVMVPVDFSGPNYGVLSVTNADNPKEH
jgi:hypothetical protein